MFCVHIVLSVRSVVGSHWLVVLRVPIWHLTWMTSYELCISLNVWRIATPWAYSVFRLYCRWPLDFVRLFSFWWWPKNDSKKSENYYMHSNRIQTFIPSIHQIFLLLAIYARVDEVWTIHHSAVNSFSLVKSKRFIAGTLIGNPKNHRLISTQIHCQSKKSVCFQKVLRAVKLEAKKGNETVKKTVKQTEWIELTW